MKNISVRLAALAAGLLLIAVVVGVLGLDGMRRAVGGLDTVYQDRVVPLRDLKEIADAYAVNTVDVTHKVRNGNLPAAEGLAAVERAEALIGKNWKAYLGTTLVEEERRLVPEIEKRMQAADTAKSRLKALLGDGSQQVLGAINDISAAMSEQSTASADIARRVESIAQMTEENSAGVRQVLGEVDELRKVAAQLDAAAGRFRTE